MPTTAWTIGLSTHPAARRAAVAARALAVAASLLAAAACAGGNRGPGDTDYESNVRLSADSTLRVARTQLELHGFTVTAAGENALVTTPRPIRADLQGGSGSLAVRSK